MKISKGKLKIYGHVYLHLGFPKWLNSKEYAYQSRRHGFDSWVRKIPWRRKGQLTPVFLPGNSHGQRSLGDYSPWSHKESDMTEATRQQQLSACGSESWATRACNIPRYQRLIFLPISYGTKRMSVSQRLFLGTLVQ